MSASFIWALMLLAVTVPCALSDDLVPVLMWDSYRDATTKHTNLPLLSKVSQQEFKGILSQKLRSNPIVIVFAEENLSIEDLSWQDESGRGAFPNLQNLSKSEDVALLYLPFVDSPLSVLEHMFPQNAGWNEAILQPEGIPILSEDTPYSNFLRVKLEDAKPSDVRSDLLKRHDATISSIYQRLRQNHDHVIVIYTSFHSSWHVEKEDIRSRKARQTRENSEKEGQEKKERTEESVEEQESEDRKEPGRFVRATTTEAPSSAASSSALPQPNTTSAPLPEWPPFMTIPILSGLMVTSILLGILGVAISAMMDIKPMLRFDDPKGKSLTFAVQE